LLELYRAPPRLAAHLRLVRDVADELTGALAREAPAFSFVREAVLFGAASHDIGKVMHVAELSGPGSAHEAAGYEILRQHGVPEEFARFARTHASWTAPDVTIEDLLVSLADKVWKAKRVTDLENLVVARLAEATGREAWQAFMDLDGVLDRLASDADDRLAFQAAYPIATP
jgi:hypothetical protein